MLQIEKNVENIKKEKKEINFRKVNLLRDEVYVALRAPQ